jgi:hypothetical protein
MSATNHMNTVHITQHALDAILALQLTVAWAGEGLADPKRLDWWRTDLVDPMGGGDLFARLFPKTHRWASLEAVRKAAIQVDREARLGLAKPDQVRTLFFWGFALDEKLMERLALHKQGDKVPLDVLPFPLNYAEETFSRSTLEEALRIPRREVPYRVVPGGRELTGAVPDTPELRAQCLAAALLPLADNYPTPFVRVED